MKWAQFFLITSAIWVAPGMPRPAAIVFGAVCLGLALLVTIRGE